MRLLIFHLEYHCEYHYTVIDQIDKLPEDGLKYSPETSRYTENTFISQKKNQNKVVLFLHLIAVVPNPKSFFRIATSVTDDAAVNPNRIKTLLANDESTFSINGKIETSSFWISNFSSSSF